ncbi:MAG: YibE/F family protein [Massilioclostridium sp.]|nr:MAG: YibE/F family protein [Massilioclostridium sp.]
MFMKTNHKKRLEELILIIVMAGILVAVFCYQNLSAISYQMYTSDSITYEKGKVDQIIEEDLQLEEGETNRYRGEQTLLVTLKTGEQKGLQIVIHNELTATHNIKATEGTNIIVKSDTPEGIEPHYSVFNYDRSMGIYCIIGIFAVLMILVGGLKGLKSLIGLLFTLLFILLFLLPMIYQGYSPIGMAILTVLVTTVFSMLLLNGFQAKTWTAIVSVMGGVLIAAIAYYLFSNVLHLTGYNLEQAEELIIIHQNTGLQVSQLLFVGILIASLGATMDMSMSITSSLYEMKRIHPQLTGKQIFVSGMKIGSDMIGTMCETLILAFVGSAVTALLVLISYGTQLQQLLSSDYIAIELLHSITGSVAVILVVPITAILTALFTTKLNWKQRSKQQS